MWLQPVDVSFACGGEDGPYGSWQVLKLASAKIYAREGQGRYPSNCVMFLQSCGLSSGRREVAEDATRGPQGVPGLWFKFM